MQIVGIIVVVAALFGSVSAHYRFTSLVVNGQTTGAYQYVRQNSNYNSPVTDITSTDARCNVGGGTGGNTSTATVAAGSSIGFQMDQAVFHLGPVDVYMGQAPTTAASWDGSGANWFKVYELGATYTPFTFTSLGKSQFGFNISSEIPSGEYLVRVEQIALHVVGSPQFYISCAQINLTGGGSATPAKVSIPGAVSPTDPGLTVNIYYPTPTNYTVPGPAVFTG